MKKYLFLILFAVAFFATAVYADSYYDNDGYRDGYQAGYRDGGQDASSRVDFDIHNGQSSDNRDNCDFRVGYVEGYADGYFHKQPISGNYDNDHDRDDRYDRGGYAGSGSYGSRGAVIVFTAEGFRGYNRTVGVGEYPTLTGSLNDSIESVRIDGNVRVILFDDKYFRGARVVLDRDAWNLGGFRNKAASMIVEQIGYDRLR